MAAAPKPQTPKTWAPRAFAALAVAVAIGLWLVPTSQAQGASIVINEIVASNSQIFPDGDGDFNDWIELYNPNPDPVDISGWQIGDDGATWPIPAGTTIGGNDYLIIFASDKGSPDDPGFPGPAGELHTNFKLSSGGETVSLIANFVLEDSVTYPALVTDQSYGTDGAGGYVIRETAEVTPLAANTAIDPTPTPTSTPAPGPPSLVINEVMASNDTTIADGDGDFEDWIELWNPTCDTIDLTGWSIADPEDVWTLPGLSLAPGDTLFIWASGKGDPTDADFPGPAEELHTNFKIASGGEALFLIDNNGLLIASALADPLEADESWARQSGETYTIATGAQVTPDALNPGQAIPPCQPTPTPEPTATPTPDATATPTPEATATPTPDLTATPTPEATPEATATPTPEPTAEPTATPTPEPTAEPTATPDATATPTPDPTPTSTPAPCASLVYVNEIMSRNGLSLFDGDGDSPDWIELYNPGDSPVTLDGWTISDSDASWPFPDDVTIAADGYLLVFASDKGDPDDPDFPGPIGELHTNFRLSGSGDSVTLTDAAGCDVDAISFGALGENESFGRTLDGSLGVFFVPQPTPGRANGTQVFVPAPECYSAAPSLGFFDIRLGRIVASNDGLLTDGDGDTPDFFEIENLNFSQVNISLFTVSDSESTWTIPNDTIIEGRSSIIIFASGKGSVTDDDFPGPEGELHANFRLSTSGEPLTLGDGAGCIIERVEYPELSTDQTYGYDETNNRAILLPGERVAPCAAPGSVIVTALMSRNDSFLSDEDGEFEDWFELTNTTDDAIDLSSWVVSDNDASWIVPADVEIDANVSVIVFASGKDRGGDGAELHTNFKLSGDGETLTVASSTSCPVDEVSFPELEDDQSYRLGDDGEFTVQGGAAPDDSDDDDDDQDDADTGDGSITVVGTCVAITELMAKNDTTIEDENGEFGDWIELTNLSDETVDLSGWEISDEKDGWTIPDGVEIEPGEFLLLWADEGDSGDAGEELHTNFKLGSSGEPITLVDADGNVAASISTYPELDDDEGFGINADGEWVKLGEDDVTPGDGPTVDDGCDFEVNVASATGASDDDADSGDADGDDGDADADDGADDGDDDADSGGQGGGEGLAQTGAETQLPLLAVQLLFVIGGALMLMARISSRRTRF